MGEKKIRPMVGKKELAEALGVTEEWIDTARKNLGLPSYKLGRLVKFYLDEVNAWIKERKEINT